MYSGCDYVTPELSRSSGSRNLLVLLLFYLETIIHSKLFYNFLHICFCSRMPIFHLRTNVKNVPESFISKVSKEVATLTNKEEAKVMVIIEDNIKITFGCSGKLFLSLLMYIVNISFLYFPWIILRFRSNRNNQFLSGNDLGT